MSLATVSSLFGKHNNTTFSQPPTGDTIPVLAFYPTKIDFGCKVGKININGVNVPDRETGSCPDSKPPGTVCRKGEKGPSPPSPGKKSQLEPSRDGETTKRDKEESIPDAMKEDQRSTE